MSRRIGVPIPEDCHPTLAGSLGGRLCLADYPGPVYEADGVGVLIDIVMGAAHRVTLIDWPGAEHWPGVGS